MNIAAFYLWYRFVDSLEGVDPRKNGKGGGGGCAALFLKPLPYHHQNLRFLLHYLRPKQKFKIPGYWWPARFAQLP